METQEKITKDLHLYNTRLIARFMDVTLMYAECGCCGKELHSGDSIQYTTSGYTTYCDNTECTEGVATIGTCLEKCWWLGDESEEAYVLEDMKYATSWDWLMPVVEKIESLGYDTELVNRLDEGGNFFCINDSVVPQTYAETKIEATYNAVIGFINDYYKLIPHTK